jgi:hypothetical protein
MNNTIRKLRDWLIAGVATIGLCQFAWSQGQIIVTTLTGTELFSFQGTGPQNAAISATNIQKFVLGSGTAGTTPIASVYTSTSATPGTVRDIWGTAKVGTGLTMTSGNLVGVRGEVDIPSGTTAGTSAFLYGAQGKWIGGGTTASGLNMTGVFAQVDASVGTYTAGTLSGLWVDMGASASSSAQSTSFGGASSIVRMTNTTNAGAALTTQVFDIYANSNYFMALGGPGGTVNYFATAGTGGSSCGVATGAVAAKVLKISVNGTDYWIPLCSSNS